MASGTETQRNAKATADEQLPRVTRRASLAPEAPEPLFSVVICTHNRAKILPGALESVLRNECNDLTFEVIVVNNASTDNTAEVVKPYLAFGVVKYIEEPRIGLSRARNTGWRAARGQYVVFLDDDGRVVNTWLHAFLEVFHRFPDAAACGGRIIPKFAKPKPAWLTGVPERLYGEYHLASDIVPCDWIPGGNAAWRKDVLELFGGFNINFGRRGRLPIMGSEESELILRARNAGYQFFYSPEAIIFHIIPEERISFKFVSLRYFGQGRVDFRFDIEFRNKTMDRRTLYQDMRRLINGLRVSISAFIRRDKATGVQSILTVFSHAGRILEHIRYNLSCITKKP